MTVKLFAEFTGKLRALTGVALFRNFCNFSIRNCLCLHRYGQKKPCQIYRFVTDCTLEKKIYDRQINKRGMANRVVDLECPDSHFNSKDMSGSLLLDLDNLIKLQSANFEHNPERFQDKIIQQLLIKGGDRITRVRIRSNLEHLVPKLPGPD